MSFSIFRLPVVQTETGFSRTTIYRYIGNGLWTKPVRIGLRSVGWPAEEVAALNKARIAGKCDQEIRTLVIKLEAARKAGS